MTVREATQHFRRQIGGLCDARETEAIWRTIMDEVMHYSPVDLVLRQDNELPEFFGDRLDNIIARLLRHEPVQYILGTARFCGLRLRVTPDTLIPRPETERLVDLVCDDLGDRADLRVLDAGTGSGCIAIALALRLKFAQVRAIDISEAALAVARQIAIDCHARVAFSLADILAAGPPSADRLDVLVSNPPYITRSERATMERNVLDYEPAAALFVPDDDPLRFYKPLAAYAAATLSAGGRIYLECNTRYTADVAALLTRAGLANAQVHPDPYAHPRYVTATQPD